jgi:hypothetical protein
MPSGLSISAIPQSPSLFALRPREGRGQPSPEIRPAYEDDVESRPTAPKPPDKNQIKSRRDKGSIDLSWRRHCRATRSWAEVKSCRRRPGSTYGSKRPCSDQMQAVIDSPESQVFFALHKFNLADGARNENLPLG